MRYPANRQIEGWADGQTKKDLPPQLIPISSLISTLYGPRREKTCLWGFANNTGADQPAHPRSLISAFAIPFLESNICKLATSEISIF